MAAVAAPSLAMSERESGGSEWDFQAMSTLQHIGRIVDGDTPALYKLRAISVAVARFHDFLFTYGFAANMALALPLPPASSAEAAGDAAVVTAAGGDGSADPARDGQAAAVPAAEGEGSADPARDGKTPAVPAAGGDGSADPAGDGKATAVAAVGGDGSGDAADRLDTEAEQPDVASSWSWGSSGSACKSTGPDVAGDSWAAAGADSLPVWDDRVPLDTGAEHHGAQPSSWWGDSWGEASGDSAAASSWGHSAEDHAGQAAAAAAEGEGHVAKKARLQKARPARPSSL